MTVEYSDWSDDQRSQIEIAQARAVLTSPPKAQSALLWLIMGLVFALTSGGRNLWDVGLIIVILVIHEAGHLAGMKFFGFSDLRMFFIPFFGAAASGRKYGASSFEHAVVLLLGPIPGIMLGTGLLIGTIFTPNMRVADAAFMFTIVNAFNLLPVSPLDGGRLFERLLFNRRYWLEVLFRWLTIISLAGLAYLLWNWVFALLCGLQLIGYRIQMKRARAGFALAARTGRLPSNPHDLTDNQVLELLASADESLQGVATNANTRATLRAQAIPELFDRASSPYASLAQTIICLGCWGAAWILSIFNVLLWAIERAHANAK